VSALLVFVLGCGVGSTIGSLVTAFSLALVIASKPRRKHDHILSRPRWPADLPVYDGEKKRIEPTRFRCPQGEMNAHDP
jgi:hypothetical protein